MSAQGQVRVPPQAPEVEKHVLGAMMLDSEAAGIVGAALTPSSFYLDKHSLIFEAIVDMGARSIQPDLLTVSDELRKRGWLEKAGGEGYLREISAEVVSSANVEAYCGIVKEKAALRAVVGAAVRAMEAAYAEDAKADVVLDGAASSMMEISAVRETSALVSWRDCMKSASEGWDAIAAGKRYGVKSGLRDYDEVIGAFQPSQTHIVASRPGVGKSALVLQIARSGARVALFSLEMLVREQVERSISNEMGMDMSIFRTPETLERHKAAIAVAMAKMANLPIHICDTTSITPLSMLSQCRRLKNRHGLDMIVVDYLQLVQASGKHERREREIGSISEALKRMAGDLKVPVIAVASLSRDCEKREDKRPMLADLRESGSIESDAHTVTFLYQESRYKRNLPAHFKDVVEINVAKNKNGPTGIKPYLFQRDRMRFVDMEKDAQRAYSAFVGGSNAAPANAEEFYGS